LTPPPALPTGSTAARTLAGKTIGVGPISVPDLAQLGRPLAEGLQVEEFHRWGGSLDREVGRALVMQLSQRLGTDQIVSYPWLVPFQPDYQVVVDMLVFAVDVREQANLDVRWSILTGADDQTPRIYASVVTRAVEDPTPAGRAAALRETVDALAEEIAAQLVR
jgi:uncharacterized lipoprotein YmbA